LSVLAAQRSENTRGVLEGALAPLELDLHPWDESNVRNQDS